MASRKGIESINQFKYCCVVFLTLELDSNPMFLFFAIKHCRLIDNAIQRTLLSCEQYPVFTNNCMLGNTLK